MGAGDEMRWGDLMAAMSDKAVHEPLPHVGEDEMEKVNE
jgi:hypothetical protein